MDNGTSIKEPGTVARRRSSGTHRFPRRLRHATSNLSDKVPDRGEPTANNVRVDNLSYGLSIAVPRFPRPTGIQSAPIRASLVMPYFAAYDIISAKFRDRIKVVTHNGERDWDKDN